VVALSADVTIKKHNTMPIEKGVRLFQQ